MFPEYVRKVEAARKMQVDFRRAGNHRAFPEAASAPPEYQSLSADNLRQLEPSLRNPGRSAFFVQEDSVDPRLLMLAALAAARNAGSEIRGTSQKSPDMRPRGSGVEVITEAVRFRHVPLSIAEAHGQARL